MIPEDIRPIVEALLKKARANEVNWVAAADLDLGSGDDDVVVSLPDYSINVFRGQDEESEPVLLVSILNDSGKRIAGGGASEGESGYGLLEELLSIATRKISGVDVALEKLGAALRAPGVVGDPKSKKQRANDDLPF